MWNSSKAILISVSFPNPNSPTWTTTAGATCPPGLCQPRMPSVLCLRRAGTSSRSQLPMMRAPLQPFTRTQRGPLMGVSCVCSCYVLFIVWGTQTVQAPSDSFATTFSLLRVSDVMSSYYQQGLLSSYLSWCSAVGKPFLLEMSSFPKSQFKLK